MNAFDIIKGHTKEILNINKDISEKRMKICYSCPIFSNKLGGICNSKLYLNPNTGDVSTTQKPGYIRGCGCRCLAKTRLATAKCVAGKW